MGNQGLTDKRLLLTAVAIIAVVAVVVVYLRQPPWEGLPSPSGEEAAGLFITSSAFDDGGSIPRRYTCDGEDISPPLSWSGAPEGTKSYALIVDDPDAPLGAFTHWVVFNLPVGVEGLAEAVPRQMELDDGGVQGMNDFEEIHYGGPCPPPGKLHRYRFHLYALDTDLNLEAGASKQDVLRSMEGHVLDEAEVTGTYIK